MLPGFYFSIPTICCPYLPCSMHSAVDLDGLQPGALALLHSLDEKLVYGCFQVGTAV